MTSTAVFVVSEESASEIGTAVGSEVGSTGPIVLNKGAAVAVAVTVSEAILSSVSAAGDGVGTGIGESEGVGVLEDIEIR